MTTSRIRVGIDVGGTFTDAVAVDADTLALLGQVKVRTTHGDKDGVARGIVQALEQLLSSVDRTAADVAFLAHGTTQATNALLEGDVATVGVIAAGRGLEGRRAAQLVKLGEIELAPGRNLPLHTAFWQVAGRKSAGAALAPLVSGLRSAGAEVIVGAEAYSVDNPAHEERIMQEALHQGLPATSTSAITKLYGLRRRTRTAVVNASILPRMLATADMVDSSIRQAQITAPLMVMRCDGGVMSLDEMRHRPLLTILSGPAAGVAGALMNERVTEGVFLETGGTSTDISIIKEGRVATRYAEIGGHPTFLSSLDVRTVGIGGGSLIRMSGGKVSDVGPRSAHIAGLDYCCYAAPEALSDARLVLDSPFAGDPADYALLETGSGRLALTVTCAANVLGLVPSTDYAYAGTDSARRGFEVLGQAMGVSADEAAEMVLQRASTRVGAVVETLLKEYELQRDAVVLIGGGGGAATVTPYLGRSLKLSHRIAEHSEVISPLGVAMALVRESVERIIPNPSQQDVLGVRGEAEQAVLAQGADAESVDVEMEIEARRSIVRAVATGAISFRARDPRGTSASGEVAKSAAAGALRVPESALDLVGHTDQLRVYGGRVRRSGFFGMLGSHTGVVAVVDREGSVIYKSRDAVWRRSTVGSAHGWLERLLAERTDYSSGEPRIPAIRVIVGGKLLNLAGLPNPTQVLGLADTDLATRADDEPAVLIAEASR
jgi:N-methylhydantoinase A/oxoprolinase/acetone carboxylase beta subunit